MATLIAALTLAAPALAQQAKVNPRVETARTLNQGLAGRAIHGQGWLIERAGFTYGVHPALLAAITGAESTYGAQGCRDNRRNIAGLNSCRHGRWVDMNGDGRSDTVPYFRTWGHFWTYFARFVRLRFGRASGPYELSGYCAGCPTWAGKVAGFMADLGFPRAGRYGRP